MEGGALFGFDQDMNLEAHGLSEQYGFDEATVCAPAFRVLKQLIQRCLADAVSSGNVFADAILQHLYRWLCRSEHLNLFCMPFDLDSSNDSAEALDIQILNLCCSPQSKLHDPALHRILHKVKAFSSTYFQVS